MMNSADVQVVTEHTGSQMPVEEDEGAQRCCSSDGALY